MTSKKQLWLLAGGNGAGKSTFYRTRLEPLGLPFVNADVIARELFPDDPEAKSYLAARIAEELRTRLLHEGRSFCFETVFSHPSKVDFVATAKALGYEVVLVFVHLSTPMLNQARVSQRVSEGGHFVPPDKVEQRIPRALANLRAVIPLCDQVRVLDNSALDHPFQPVVTVRRGRVEEHVSPLPPWAATLFEP